MNTWTTGRCPCSHGRWVVCRQLSLGELRCSLRESVCYRNIQLSALLLCCLSSCSSAENSGAWLGSHFFNTKALLLCPVNLWNGSEVPLWKGFLFLSTFSLLCVSNILFYNISTDQNSIYFNSIKVKEEQQDATTKVNWPDKFSIWLCSGELVALDDCRASVWSAGMKECCVILWQPLDYMHALQRKRKLSETDGESSLPNTPSVDDVKKEKKKKKAKHQEADPEGLEQETQMEVRNFNWIPWLLVTRFSCWMWSGRVHFFIKY